MADTVNTGGVDTTTGLPVGYSAPASSFTQAPNASTFVSPTAALTGGNGTPFSSTPSSTPTAPVVPPTPSISSAVLAPQTPTPYVTPAPSPIPDISSLATVSTPPLTETPGQQQASDLTARLEDLNNEMTGESADQTAAYENAGFTVDAQGNPTNQTLTDLNNQITTLQNQAKAIPQQLQNDAQGRGITTAGLSSIQSAALRNNSVQALSVAAQASALKDNLGTAKLLADQAISAKYDPIQAQIDAATKNLQLILNDPQTTIDEKNQATAQLDAQKTQQNNLDIAKTNAADVQNVALLAAKNGADASTLQSISAATDGPSALAIATKAGFGTSDVQDLMTKYPDAGIQPGDSISSAQAKVLQSPTYTLAQKSALLDVATKEQTLANAQAASDPNAVGSFISSLQGYNGQQYMTPTDLTGYDAATKNALTEAAKAQGIPILSAKDADAVDSIQAAKSNLSDFTSFLQGAQTGQAGITLPTNWLGQPQQYANVQFNKFLQTNGQLASYQAWTAQIPTLLSALKGAGTGSGGSSRLFGTITSLLPADTDTLPTAMAKLSHIQDILDNGAQSILGTKGSSATPSVGASVSSANGLPDGTTAKGADGKTYVVQNGQFVAQ